MKKTISVLLIFMLILSTLPMGIAAEEIIEENNSIDIFEMTQQLTELIEEYDDGQFATITLSREDAVAVAEKTELYDISLEAAIETLIPAEDDEAAAGEMQVIPDESSASDTDENEECEAIDAVEVIEEAADREGLEVTQAEDGSITISKPYQTKRIIVKSDTKPEDENAAEIIGGFDDIYVLQYETPEEAAAAEQYFSGLDNVDFCCEDAVVSACDNYLSWGYGESYMNESNYLSWLTGQDIPDTEVTVAVIDTGVAYDHPFLKGRIDTEHDYDFVNNDDDAYDDRYHGTYCAGIVADGTPSNVKIIPIKALSAGGKGTFTQVYLSIEYAISLGVDVINLSLGSVSAINPYTELIDRATEQGIIVCIAAGNSNMDASGFSPASAESAITVAAVDSDLIRADFSNYGDVVDIAAPGVDVQCAYPPEERGGVGRYRLASGTSMAAPHVAAAAACLKCFDKRINTVTAMTYFEKTAKPAYGLKESIGVGMICMENILSGSDSFFSLSDAQREIYPGQEFVITSAMNPISDVVWETSDATVATVDNGTVTGIANGECVITATANGESRRCAVTVSTLSISFPEEAFIMYTGHTYLMPFSLSHIKAPLEWSSDDTSVINVSVTGRVTAVSPGVTTVHVTAGKGTISEATAECEITVKEIGAWYSADNSVNIISTAEELFEFSIVVNKGFAHAKTSFRISDSVDYIDMSGYDWTPAGYYCNFCGTFDGNNKPVRNLKCDFSANDASCGFFSNVSGGTVKNLILENASVTGKDSTGGICGSITGGRIENCYVSGSIESVNEYAGGIVGSARAATVISNCENNAEINARVYAGGIAGYIFDNSIIVNCINYGNPYAERSSGGICGAVLFPGSGNTTNHSGRDFSVWRANAIINCVNAGTAVSSVSAYNNAPYVAVACYVLDGVTETNGINDNSNRYYNDILSFDGNYRLTATGSDLVEILNSNSVYFGGNSGGIVLNGFEYRNGKVHLQSGPVSVFAFENRDVRMVVGDVYTPCVIGADINSSLTFSSSDENVATVSPQGIITAVGGGSAFIKAEGPTGTAQMNVTVADVGDWYNLSNTEFHIDSTTDFYEFAGLVESSFDDFKGKTVYLDCDLDFSDCDDIVSAGGINKTVFRGIFDGCRHSVISPKLTRDDNVYPLFYCISENAAIRDLDVRNVVNHIPGMMAVLCGMVDYGCVISGCTVSGMVSHVAGIALSNYGTITACNVSVGINNVFRASGICHENFGVINDCSFTGSMGKVFEAYGICCDNKKTIVNCKNYGSFSAFNVAYGIDCENSIYAAKIINCINRGSFSGSGTVIGITETTRQYPVVGNCVTDAQINTTGAIYLTVKEKTHYDNVSNCYYSNLSTAREDGVYAGIGVMFDSQTLQLDSGENVVTVLNAFVDEYNAASPAVELKH